MKARHFEIALGSEKSQITVGAPLSGLPDVFAAHAKSGCSVGLVVDAGVPRSPIAELQAALKAKGFVVSVVAVPSGERSKTLAQAGRLYRRLAKERFDRSSWLIAVGGGVVGDMTGFVAATYLRGISYVQAPTTLLAQVDASIGGKTAVDLPEGKNLAGAFYHPALVWIDPTLLKSLPREHWRNGAAEVIKYGAIFDAKLFAELEEKIELLVKGYAPDWGPIISRCVQLKAQTVQKDPREKSGLRALLNFGHTVGHAVEAAGGYSDYLHGEAISIGMFVAGYMSSHVVDFPDLDRIRLGTLLTKAGLPAQVRKPIARETLMSYLARDKKSSAGSVRFVLLKAIGKAVSGQTVDEEVLDAALRMSGL
jgi:3-dehydroquinate synthase